MEVILYDGPNRDDLLPLTFTRPVCDLRIGILTIRQKWELWLDTEVGVLTQEYLQHKYRKASEDIALYIDGSVCPDKDLVKLLKGLNPVKGVLMNDRIIAHVGPWPIPSMRLETSEEDVLTIDHPWDVFSKNGRALEADFELITKGRTSQPLSNSVTVIGDGPIFLEKGAKAEACILNASNGPIYIGPDAEVMEGSVIRGPFALCEGSSVKMGAKIYGPTTIGPYSKVGGEVNNSVITGYSNKGHDGFLGNSVLGEWCNLGADTNNSNLKNNYEDVRAWHYPTERFKRTHLQFCGLIMGDHSKSGINTMFNTGTVVGVSSNVFGAGFPRTFIPSFSWGGASGFSEYRFEKAMETAERVMQRRNKELDDAERSALKTVFDLTARYRT